MSKSSHLYWPFLFIFIVMLVETTGIESGEAQPTVSYIAVAAGGTFSLALMNDHTVRA